MRKLLTSSVGVLAAMLMVGSAVEVAYADEAPRRAAPQRQRQQPQQQPQQQASNWNGGQAGGSNGASSVNNNFVEPGAYNFFNCAPGAGGFFFGGSPCYETPFQFNSRKTTWVGGGFLGYRWQMGNTVFGVEADLNYKNGSTSYAQHSRTPYNSFDSFTGSQKQGWDSSFRARWGILVSPWMLAYVTGGLAVGNVSGSFSYVGSPCASLPCASPTVVGAASWNETRVGGTFGGGVEWMLNSLWTARIEYRHTNFGSFTKDVPLAVVNGPCPFPGQCGSNAHIDLKAFDNRVTFGLALNL